MSESAMSPVFACGMPYPWVPPWAWQPPARPAPVLDFKPVACDHCFCSEDDTPIGTGPHLICCKCRTRMAEKFVRAWFDLLAKQALANAE